MPAIAHSVFELIDRFSTALSLAEVWQTYLSAARLAGYRHGLVFFAGDESTLSERIVLDAMPLGWSDAYSAARCEQIDPVAEKLQHSTTPFTWRLKHWENIQDLRPWHDLDHQAGLCGGLIIPDWSGGELRAIGLAGADIKDVHPYDRMALHFAGLEMMHRKDVPAARARDHEEGLRLSGREMECLRWIAAGKTDWEIGRILSISEKTVNAHIERAKHKLRVTTRSQAIVTALRLKLIEP